MELIHKLGLSKKLIELKGGKETLYFQDKKRLDAEFVNEKLNKLNNFIKKIYKNIY